MGLATADAVTTRPWATALSMLKASSGAPVVFGGPVTAQSLRLTYFLGERTDALAGLEVRRGAGLGGKAWATASIASVDEYRTAAEITHEYDDPVGQEGLRAVVAAPVLWNRRVRGVVYAGMREVSTAGDRLKEVALLAAARLSRELAIEEELARRVEGERSEIARLQEQVRELHAGLRAILRASPDTGVRAEVERLLALTVRQPRPGPEMSARQLDVLALVAGGLTYPAIATRLHLSPQTVKSYMRDINRRLGARSRHEAVVLARQQGVPL